MSRMRAFMDALVVAPCSHEAAKYAVMHWHYSRAMPLGKLVKGGVWEGGRFIGAAIFSRGANRNLAMPYGLTQAECVELTRVALDNHIAPVSQIVALAIGMLRSANPGLRLIVSFADEHEGHRGTIYQAGNWVYTGRAPSQEEVRYCGRWYHHRMQHASSYSLHSPTAALSAEDLERLPKRVKPGKHRYLYPLDRAMRRKIAPLARPYPQSAGEGSTVSRRPSGSEVQVQPLASAL